MIWMITIKQKNILNISIWLYRWDANFHLEFGVNLGVIAIKWYIASIRSLELEQSH